jgi:translocation and assembly module TamA
LSIKSFFTYPCFCFLIACMLLCLSGPACAAAPLHYEMDFVGSTPACTEEMKRVSQLLALADQPPISLAALQRRSELDVARFVKALHNHAYYDVKIDSNLITSSTPIKVLFTCTLGHQYTIGEHAVTDCISGHSIDVDIGIKLGDIAYASSIINSQELLLLRLAAMGYPQARISKRDIVADQKEKKLLINFVVDRGHLMRFGNVIITGHSHVNEDFIRDKIAWNEGDLYDPQLIETTQQALEDTHLFNTVAISLAKEHADSECQTIEISLCEAKHRTIAAGVSYTTQRGCGTSFEWEHRNVTGKGNCVNATLNLWQKSQTGTLSYRLPEFGSKDQNLLLSAAVDREITRGYHDTSLKLLAIFDRSLFPHINIGYGAVYQTLFTSHSDNNGTFNLFKCPLSLRYSRINSSKNPTSGYTFSGKLTPSLQLSRHQFAYSPLVLSATYYLPLTANNSIVFAAKGTIGTIIGAKRRSIPPSELFYAGSENTLRGYNYMTVSPLNSHHKPVGGKSMAIMNLETRFKLNDKIGLVTFYDVGNVYASPMIPLGHKQLQSVGSGLRYETPVGPLRFDVAVPLNRRKHIDSAYQLYMSIGQSF